MNKQTTEKPQILREQDEEPIAHAAISNNRPQRAEPRDELEFELIEPPFGSHRFAHGE